MNALVYSAYGSPDVLRHEDVEMPVPAAGELLVKVHAASVNPADWHLMRGTPLPIRLGRGWTHPHTTQRLGLDYSGTVAAVGGGVQQFSVGDKVLGAGSGTLAEYVRAAAASAAAKPDNVTFEEAAGVAVAGVTALHALRNHGRVQPGQQVLINGASGGVGTFAVQLAKVFGASVTGVQSTRNLELVRSLGADRVIDYTLDDFTSGGTQYDVVLDNIANRPLSEVRRIVRPAGVYIPNGGGSVDRPATVGGILRMVAASLFISQKVKLFVAKPNHDDLQTLAGLMRDGRLRTVIDTSYPFADAAQAMRHLESGRVRGKIVVTIA
jgi:NADPH:quinone reductase-like Zn-dependent oxidoreductase